MGRLNTPPAQPPLNSDPSIPFYELCPLARMTTQDKFLSDLVAVSPAGPTDSPSAGTLGPGRQPPTAAHLELPGLECSSLGDADVRLLSLVIRDI